MSVNHVVIQSYQGDSDTISGSTNYYGDSSIRLDVTFIASTVSSTSGTGSVCTINTATNHYLQTGTTVTVSGSSTSGYNVGPVAITVTSATAFTYSGSGTGASTGTIYTINTQKVTQSIVRANVVSMAWSCDQACTVSINSSGGSGGSFSITAGGAPAIFNTANIGTTITADITSIYVANTGLSATGTCKMRACMSV